MTENNPRTKGASVVTRYSLTGRPVYPIPHDGVPFEFENQPPEMTHTFRSDAFYRAPDSSAVAFADSVMDKLSMVTVQISRPAPRLLCFRSTFPAFANHRWATMRITRYYPIPTFSGVDFGSSRSLVVHFGASTFCKSTQMSLRIDDSRQPTPEVDEPPKRRPAATLDGVKR